MDSAEYFECNLCFKELLATDLFVDCCGVTYCDSCVVDYLHVEGNAFQCQICHRFNELPAGFLDQRKQATSLTAAPAVNMQPAATSVVNMPPAAAPVVTTPPAAAPVVTSQLQPLLSPCSQLLQLQLLHQGWLGPFPVIYYDLVSPCDLFGHQRSLLPTWLPPDPLPKTPAQLTMVTMKMKGRLVKPSSCQPQQQQHEMTRHVTVT
jgi:hypothetical protein